LFLATTIYSHQYILHVLPSSADCIRKHDVAVPDVEFFVEDLEVGDGAGVATCAPVGMPLSQGIAG
jgi:hypothetical protein